MKLFLATREWDMDKCCWVVAKTRAIAERNAEILMNFADYKDDDERFDDAHIVFEIPPLVLEMFVVAIKDNKVPPELAQRNVNDNVVGRMWCD